MFTHTDVLRKCSNSRYNTFIICCSFVNLLKIAESHMSFLSLFFSVAVCRFPNTGDDWYVLVGVARDMILNPRSAGGGFIYTYRLISGGEKLEFVHKVGLTPKGVIDQWKDGLFEKMGCLCSRKIQISLQMVLRDQRKRRKRTVVFPFVQKVENLQQPRFISGSSILKQEAIWRVRPVHIPFYYS